MQRGLCLDPPTKKDGQPKIDPDTKQPMGRDSTTPTPAARSESRPPSKRRKVDIAASPKSDPGPFARWEFIDGYQSFYSTFYPVRYKTPAFLPRITYESAEQEYCLRQALLIKKHDLVKTDDAVCDARELAVYILRNGKKPALFREWTAAYEWTDEATEEWDRTMFGQLLAVTGAKLLDNPHQWHTLLKLKAKTPIAVLSTDKDMGVGYL